MTLQEVYSPTLSPYLNTNTQKFFIRKDFKPAPVKLDNLELLEGQNNYEDWASQMSMAFKPIGLYDIIVNGVHPDPYTTIEKHETYEALSNHAMPVLIQVISKPILKKILQLSTSHEIWKALKETFYRDNTFSFVHQVADLCSLSTQLEKDKSVVDFMEKFDDQWTRVYQMTARPDPYDQKFCAFLEEDYVKHDFLLAALSKNYPNPVNNLTTKSDLSYAELKHHIRALVSASQLSTPTSTPTIIDVALVTENKRAHRCQGKVHHNQNQNQMVQSPIDECSYCKKHGNTYKGHLWQNC